MEIKNAVVLVTGSNRGIGQALVMQLLQRDVRRVYAAARNPEQLHSLVAIDSERIVPVQIDITKPEEVAAVADKVVGINLLINNAGVMAHSSMLTGDLEMIERDMQTNYLGTLNVIRSFAPVLEKNSPGAIVNILSLVSLACIPVIGGYCASKAAALSLTQAIRAELSDKRIDVHGVLPGAVDTDMGRDFDIAKTSPNDVAQSILQGVEADEEDIFPDMMSTETYAAWIKDRKFVERQFASMA